MEDVQGGDLSARKRILSNSQFWLSYDLLKKRPKLGIQLPNAGDDNPSCRILTVRNIISTLVLYYVKMYQFPLRSGGVRSMMDVRVFWCVEM